MKDFMISFSFKDESEAKWINEILQEAGYSTIFAGTDFKAGNDFLHEMDKAVEGAEKLIVVYSENYDTSNWAPAELRSFLHDDPKGELKKIIPILIGNVKPKGIIKSRIYIDISKELSANKEQAKQKILFSLSNEKISLENTISIPFNPIYMPKIKRKWSNNEKEQFIADTFKSIQIFFDNALQQVKNQHPHFSYTLEESSPKAFTVKLFLYDELVDNFQIWINESFGSSSNIIAYYQSPHNIYSGYSSMNGWLSLEDDGQILFWKASFLGFSDAEIPDKLSVANATEYLWRQCVKSLESIHP